MTMKRMILAASAAALLLSGCAVTDEVASWFSSSGKMSKLRGVRIPVMALDENLKVDPELAATAVVLPPPYRNADWPQPGGYSSNAMYHLAAPGRLREVWRAQAGKGTDSDSDLTSTPVIGGGLDFRAGFRSPYLGLPRRQRPGSLGQAAGAQERHRPADLVGPSWANPIPIDPPQGMGGGVAYDDGKIYVTSRLRRA